MRTRVCITEILVIGLGVSSFVFSAAEGITLVMIFLGGSAGIRSCAKLQYSIVVKHFIRYAAIDIA